MGRGKRDLRLPHPTRHHPTSSPAPLAAAGACRRRRAPCPPRSRGPSTSPAAARVRRQRRPVGWVERPRRETHAVGATLLPRGLRPLGGLHPPYVASSDAPLRPPRGWAPAPLNPLLVTRVAWTPASLRSTHPPPERPGPPLSERRRRAWRLGSASAVAARRGPAAGAVGISRAVVVLLGELVELALGRVAAAGRADRDVA